jgi:ZIP family zinc transporter
VTPTVVAAVLMLSLMSFVTTAAGVALALWVRWSERAVAAGIGFSVGIMVSISLLELLPDSISAVGTAHTATAAALGVALLWLAHWLIPHIHLVAENRGGASAPTRTAYLVVLGLVLHDLPEGFAMANAYIAAPALGILTAIAIALHNLPEEFAMAMPAAALKRKRLLYGAALLSALAEPVGAILGLAAVGVAPALNSAFLAFAAGAMLFVSVHELVPMARRYRHGGHFVLGIASGVLVYVLLERIIAAASCAFAS